MNIYAASALYKQWRVCVAGLTFVTLSFANGPDTPMKHVALSLVVHDADKAKPAAPVAQPKQDDTADAPPIFTHTPATLEASEAANGKATKSEAKDTDAPVTMPKMEIFGKRLDALTRELRENDWANRWEENLTHPSDLDSAINGKFILPFFGGSSAAVRAEQAKFRVRLLEFERQLIVAIDVASTPEEKTNLRKFLEEIRSMRRGYGYGDTFRGGK